MGFGRDYWSANYSEPETMDGVFNARRHAAYLEALFGLEEVTIRSVVDLGFGLGHLFHAVLRTFRPARAFGIEPSEPAFAQARRRLKGVRVEPISLQAWAARPSPTYDLGLCTSVLQYLSDADVRRLVPILAKRVRYLYLTVPTDEELTMQARELDLDDKWALRRTRAWYRRQLGRGFTFVASRLLESRIHFKDKDSRFTDQLFRF